MREHLRVGIDARMNGNHFHGAAMTTIALIRELCATSTDTEKYSILTSDHDAAWVRTAVDDRAELLTSSAVEAGVPSRMKQSIQKLPAVSNVAAFFDRNFPGHVRVAESDGAIEGAGLDVMHFTMQAGFRTHVPFIYQPHDLQHLHYPENFTRAERAWREATYRTLCQDAAAIAVMTEWGKRDLVVKFGLPPNKVTVIPWAPLISQPRDRQDDSSVLRKYAITGPFLLYPAQTWPHKNHINLIRAISVLKNSGLDLTLICTGRCNELHPNIEREMRRLKLENIVRFLDFVPHSHMAALYRSCRALVFPSKFEGWGLPVTDAMHAGVPVVCSNLAVLREQTAEAAQTFDPNDVDAMADAIARVWQDEALRTELVALGKQRARLFTWRRTADSYRQLYRRVAKDAGIRRSEPEHFPQIAIHAPKAGRAPAQAGGA
jgi:glycosyltransferase involved in cell wall biosynthesis